MKLYYTKDACSLVARIIINELGKECHYESVDLKTKKTETGEDFLKINPKGSVPVLQLSNSEILTENAVILQYLAESSNAFSLLPPPDDFKRYGVLMWLNYIATELHKGIGILFNPSITSEMKEQIFKPLIEARLNYIENHLKHHPYLVGEEFTLPDAYLFVMLRWALYFKLNLKKWSNLTRYFNLLNKRPSVLLSLEQEDGFVHKK